MQRLTLVIGGLLVALGVVAYVIYLGTPQQSVTALIPAFVGLLLLVCAAIAARGDRARMHATHAALTIALLAALGSLMQVAQLGEVFAGTALRPGAAVVGTVMFVLLLVYLVLGVRSFIAARRSRTNA